MVKKLVLVITGVETEEVLERWVFDVETDEKVLQTGETRYKRRGDKRPVLVLVITF